jgi:hypothetical protein
MRLPGERCLHACFRLSVDLVSTPPARSPHLPGLRRSTSPRCRPKGSLMRSPAPARCRVQIGWVGSSVARLVESCGRTHWAALRVDYLISLSLEAGWSTAAGPIAVALSRRKQGFESPRERHEINSLAIKVPECPVGVPFGSLARNFLAPLRRSIRGLARARSLRCHCREIL